MAMEAERLLRQARAVLRDFFGAGDPDRVIFTLNCTDALNIALKGLLKPGDHVVTSCQEHNSVSRPLNRLRELGVEHSRVPLSAGGFVDPAAAAGLIRAQTRMIVLSHASNVLGTIQPVAEIGRLAREHGLLFVLDAAQTAGEVPIDMRKTPVDLLACPGHKGLMGPPGTGVLVVGENVEVGSLREGGTGSVSDEPVHPDRYPDRLEAGTPNTAGIAGLKAGLEFIREVGLEQIRAHKRDLLSRLLRGFAAIEGVTVYGPPGPDDRAGLVSFNIAGWDPREAASLMDARFGLACRAGLHCAPWAHQALGTFPAGAIRFSFGYFNTAAEVEEALRAVAVLAENPV